MLLQKMNKFKLISKLFTDAKLSSEFIFCNNGIHSINRELIYYIKISDAYNSDVNLYSNLNLFLSEYDPANKKINLHLIIHEIRSLLFFSTRTPIELNKIRLYFPK
jgi:hypothetical protein